MTQQALFYEQAAAVTVERHRGLRLSPRTSFAFASQTNCVPLMAVEFPKAVGDYAIVFVRSEGQVLPVVLLGLESGRNTFVTAAGGWDARYLPAFVRRYPFVFSTQDDGHSFVLCVDESYAGLNRTGSGEALFNDDGETSPFLGQVLGFLKEYERQYRLTKLFCGELERLSLLTPMQANVSLSDGESLSLAGFLTVSRDKLKHLPGAELEKLARENVLELIYVHLCSLEQLPHLVTRVNRLKHPT